MVEFDPFRLQLSHQRPDHLADTVFVIPDDDRKAAPQLSDVTGYDNPMLGQKTANLIDKPDPFGDQTLADAMESAP